MARMGTGPAARVSVLLAAAFMSGAAVAQEPADTIYRGGPILTIEDAAPRAEAVAVKDGRILAVGTLADVMPHQGEATELFELEGRALLPGFVDSLRNRGTRQGRISAGEGHDQGGRRRLRRRG